MYKLQFFIGVVPPEKYKQQIAEFRNRWTSNGLRHVVEPHITVKAQSGLTSDLAWLNNVRNTCSSFPSFMLSLAEPSSYGTAVTFLNVESNEIFDLHKRIMDSISQPPESAFAYELDGFHPHLTLGQTRWGMDALEVEEMKSEAKTMLAPFPTFDVTYVRVYKEVELNKYLPFEDIQFA